MACPSRMGLLNNSITFVSVSIELYEFCCSWPRAAQVLLNAPEDSAKKKKRGERAKKKRGERAKKKEESAQKKKRGARKKKRGARKKNERGARKKKEESAQKRGERAKKRGEVLASLPAST